jgi:hypothetical protein
MFGGSNPVSFSGEGRLKVQFHDFLDCPSFARKDRSWTQANWEGNEDMMRIGMFSKHASRYLYQFLSRSYGRWFRARPNTP